MPNCAEQNFISYFQELNEILAKVRIAVSTQDLNVQLSENRILFKKLKNLLKQDFFIIQFFNNEVKT